MASRGAMVAGSSGADFEHREQVAAHYQQSVLYKSRMRYAMFFHCVLFVVMCLKLSADILDRLDIFILELEELHIPQPLLWEWWWSASLLAAPLGLRALRRNCARSLRRHCGALLVLAGAPLMLAVVQHGAALVTLAGAADDVGEEADVPRWRGVPVAAPAAAFVLLAAQVLAAQLWCARRLLTVWHARRVNKGQ